MSNGIMTTEHTLKHDYIDCFTHGAAPRVVIYRKGYHRIYNPSRASFRRIVLFLKAKRAHISPWVSRVGWTAEIEREDEQA